MSATSNRVLLSYVEESTFGITPNSALQEIRMTGESLKGDTTTTNSAEIRDDRMISDVLRTMVAASGDINFELSYGSFDDFMVAALRSAGWSTGEAVITTSTDLTFASNTITLGSGSWTNTPAAGDWIRITGATDNANNVGYFKVTAATSTVITVAQTFTDTGAESGSVTIYNGAQITNGTTETSFSIERKYQDLTDIHEGFVGMEIETFNLSITAEGLVTGSFGFMGKLASSDATSDGIGDGSYTDANTNSIINATDNVQGIQENYADLGSTAFSLSLTNNLRGRTQIGALGYQSMGDGQIELTGTIQKYFENNTLFDKYLNFTETSLVVIINDATTVATGNAYVIEIPLVNFTSGQRTAGGSNADIIADLAWSAKRDATDDAMIRIVKFDSLS